MKPPAETDAKMEHSEEEDISPLIGTSLDQSELWGEVDPASLISSDKIDQSSIGMANFKSKKKAKTSPRNARKLSYFQHSSPENEADMSPSQVARHRWKTAAIKIKLVKDPWYEFHIEKCSVEKVVRHRYDPIRKNWVKDECVVKMESKQFANGAMRACFRLKKLSNFSHHKNWQHASNYVAKSYKDPQMPRERYFDDVRLQMDAKLWAEVFNRHNPPKKIDIMQVCILEFVERDGSPLYHLEHYIEGNYIKYNSNAGFVDDLHIRLTPQAFSHFTFEFSSHELIVVDIQGVGDLYTDPQIHTANGTEYGDGNLGIKGFALFFSSHICNDICHSLGLTQFDLAPSEVKSHSKIIQSMNSSACTRMSSNGHAKNGGVSGYKRELSHGSGDHYSARTKYLLSRLSSCDENSNELFDSDDLSTSYCSSSSPLGNHSFSSSTLRPPVNASSASRDSDYSNDTSCCTESPFSNDEAIRFIQSTRFGKPRSSAIVVEKHAVLNSDTEFALREQALAHGGFLADSRLGKVHLEICKYHEFGRFVLDEEHDAIDYEAAFFHLQQAASLNVTEALVNISKIYMQLPHDILPDYKVEENDENYQTGFEYLTEAAERGDKWSLHFVAKAYDTGIGLPKSSVIDWSKSIEFYRRILRDESSDERPSDESYSDITTECEPAYLILGRIGEMLLAGKNGVDQNAEEAADLFTEAAEKAMQFGKGRLANKYYEMAETARSSSE